MNPIYYCAAWTECGCLLTCNHQHTTILEATQCLSQAGSYVVAVEDGIACALGEQEEAQFRRTPRDLPKPAALQYEPSGYAVMIRVRIADYWTWTTWIRCETFQDAVAHARVHDVVVRFGSARWSAMLRSREPAFLTPAPLLSDAHTQRQDCETLIEYVSRVVPSPPEAAQRETAESLRPYTASDECAPQTFVELVLEWISNCEAKLEKSIHVLRVFVAGLILGSRKKAR